MSYYKYYEKLKQSGKILNFFDVTKEELFQMWYVENYDDVFIAQLFGVDESIISNKRKSYDINARNKKYDNIMQVGGIEEKLKEYELRVNFE